MIVNFMYIWISQNTYQTFKCYHPRNSGLQDSSLMNMPGCYRVNVLRETAADMFSIAGVLNQRCLCPLAQCLEVFLMVTTWWWGREASGIKMCRGPRCSQTCYNVQDSSPPPYPPSPGDKGFLMQNDSGIEGQKAHPIATLTSSRWVQNSEQSALIESAVSPQVKPVHGVGSPPTPTHSPSLSGIYHRASC